MSAPLCKGCESRGELPHMLEVSRQNFKSGVQDEVVTYRCPICGYTETVTVVYDDAMGTHQPEALAQS